MAHDDWPTLRLDEWEPTYLTLHRWAQIVGKVRLSLDFAVNHWWHVTLYVTDRGLTTGPMPCGHRQLSMTFDFCSHRLVAHTSDKRTDSFALEPMSVADFYARVEELLRRLDVNAHIWPVPVEVADTTPFTVDWRHASYDRRQVEKLHNVLIAVDRVFARYRGTFVGKSSPVHFFWGAFDLAVTRFSGRRNPHPPPGHVMEEAYSHEVISHGFWPGGDWFNGERIDEAVFYAYAMPEPEGFRSARVRPAEANYDPRFGEFLLPYESVRSADDPDSVLLEFMESTYLAAATPAGWNVEELRHAG
jgi:hypothetical protein